MKFKQQHLLAAAIALALGGVSQSEASISYNNLSVDLSEAQNSGGWDWTNGDPGYTGNMAVTWAALIENAGGVAASETASSAGVGYTLGVGARAYKDGTTNWGHNADFGLFRLEHDATVTITMRSDSEPDLYPNGADLRPAFGLWSGWAAENTGSRHDEFRMNGALDPMGENPLGTLGLGVVDANAWAVAAFQGTTASASLTRFLTAGDYTLILGGYDGTTGGQHLAYALEINAAPAPVPIPTAAWLFAGGLATLISKRRGRAT